jgi:epsilon-lactone hydrolase
MASLHAKVVKQLISSYKNHWSKGTVEQQRIRHEKKAKWFRLPRDIKIEPIKIHQLSAAWIQCAEPKPGLVLYLHGGAYTLGSIHVYRNLLARVAAATRMRVLGINYRLAPEHPFPAALEDSLNAYEWLLNQGLHASEIAIAGDSAGGGLALATLLALREVGQPLPACGVALSPWVDLTLSCDSINLKSAVDPILSPNQLERCADYYAGNHQKDHPLISPLFADLKGLPPLLIQVGSEEILLDEALQLAAKAQSAGVDIQLKTWQGLFHVFQIIPWLPESRMSLEQIGAFITEKIK